MKLGQPRRITRSIGNHTGPRQLELPPNIPVSDSAGRYVHFVLLAVPVEPVRLLEVAARDSPDAVVAEELAFVEHHREDPTQPILVHERGEAAALGADVRKWANWAITSASATHVVADPVQQPREALEQITLEHGGGADRQQPDQRANLEPDRLPVGIRMTS